MEPSVVICKLSRGSYIMCDLDLCFPASKSWIRDVFKKWIRYSFDSDRIMLHVRDYLQAKVDELEKECNTFTNKESISCVAHMRLLAQYKANLELWISLDPVCGLT